MDAEFGSGNDAEFSEQEPGADYRMAGQRQFRVVVKMRRLCESAIIRGALDENRFGEVHLARDGLHFRGGKAVAIGDDGQRVACERLVVNTSSV